jgi:hypothetical protein
MEFFHFSKSDRKDLPPRTLHKSKSFQNKVIIVNGFNGSGKTLFSPIVSSIKTVELMAFAYEIEWCSAFLYSKQMDFNAYKEFVKLAVDHLTYNQMMSRSVNFRPSDLSSALSYRPRLTYLKRLFGEGDNAIPDKIKKQSPILSLTTCHLMPVFPSLAQALNERMLFIEIVRDPMFMFHQLLILHRTVIAPQLEKDFTLRASEKGVHATYLDFYSDPSVFENIAKADDVSTVISYLERMVKFYLSLDFNDFTKNRASFMLIPFERFVLSPKSWVESIVSFSGQSWTASIDSEMKRQKVPRKLLRLGKKMAVYRRFGWADDDVNSDMTLDAENTSYREKMANLINNREAYLRLEKLSDEYHRWIGSIPNFVYINK